MQSPHPMVKPEIMSPVGDWTALHAAIEAGADAVYFGLQHFSARAKVGFALNELPQIYRTLHARGVKGYLTFNTLVFDSELAQAAQTLATIAAAGADAIIVQDWGVAQLAQRIAPDLPVHGSTQMSITSAEGVQHAQQLGVRRVVLARELALTEIKAIRAKTDCELEVFVHGALCVSYSGQCFSSEAWGGRSANRGQCAQACRLPYELLLDGALHPLGEARYLLSPGDLFALAQVPELITLGIHAFKIEGRYKDANYVGLTTQTYRQAVDAAWAGQAVPDVQHAEQRLAQVYSRGLGAHFLSGTNHQTVVQGRAPRHRGVLLGKVRQINHGWVSVTAACENLDPPLQPGDGVVFDAADWRSPQEAEEGGRLYAVEQDARGWRLAFGNHAIEWQRVQVGDWVWRTHSPELEKQTRVFTQSAQPLAKQPVQVQVRAQVGQPLSLVWQLQADPSIQASVQATEPLVAAQQQPLQAAQLQAQLGRLGNTPYQLVGLTLESSGQPFVPVALLNQLRRAAVADLAAQQSTLHPHPNQDGQLALQMLAEQIVPIPQAAAASQQLHLLVRNPEQLQAALSIHPASITIDYLELEGLRAAVAQVREQGVFVRVASPRILKPNEQRILQFLLRLDCAILVRSAGLLQAILTQTSASTRPTLFGDFSLNVANALSAQQFLAHGLARLTPTHDLNAEQLAELATRMGGAALEVVAYQHLPIFHTEHCVFCRFLSTGTSYRDCGRPCERHQVALRDEHGRAHPVLADVGCRNTVFGAEAQTAPQHLAVWQQAGITHFRLEFVQETAAQVRAISKAFAATLSGRQNSTQLAQQLQKHSPQGVTAGSLFVPQRVLLPML